MLQEIFVVAESSRFVYLSWARFSSEDVMLHVSLINEHFDAVHNIFAAVLFSFLEECSVLWSDRDVKADWIVFEELIRKTEVSIAWSCAENDREISALIEDFLQILNHDQTRVTSNELHSVFVGSVIDDWDQSELFQRVDSCFGSRACSENQSVFIFEQETLLFDELFDWFEDTVPISVVTFIKKHKKQVSNLLFAYHRAYYRS